MVNSIAEAPSTPAVETGAKTDQQTGGGGFVAMLAGIVAPQQGASAQTKASDKAADANASPAADSKTTADEADAAMMAVLAGAQAAAQSQAKVDAAQVVQPQEAAEPAPTPVANAAQQTEKDKAVSLVPDELIASNQQQVSDADKIVESKVGNVAAQDQLGIEEAKQPKDTKLTATRAASTTANENVKQKSSKDEQASVKTTAFAEAPKTSDQAIKLSSESTEQMQTASVMIDQAQQMAKAPEQVAAVATPDTDPKLSAAKADNQDVVDALKSATVQAPQVKALPESATPGGDFAATLMAARLNPAGQKSQTGEVLLGTDAQDDAKDSASEKFNRNTAASAVAGSRKPEQASADSGTRIQVEWQPTQTVTVSASSSGGGFGQTLQSSGGSARQSETKDLTVGSTNQQAFGVEMKTQMATEPIIKQAQTTAAQAPQTDPTLGEKMVSQVVREVTLHKLGDNTTLSIRLDPPELGTLKVSVTSNSGVLTTQLESSNSVVRGILETHLPALKDALSNAGIEVSKFSVSSGLDFSQNQPRQQQAWQPTRLAPAIEFDPQGQDAQPVIPAAISGSQTQATSHSWLA